MSEGIPMPDEPKEIKYEPKIVVHTIDGKEIMIPIEDLELKEGDFIFKSQKDGKWYIRRDNKMSEEGIIKIIKEELSFFRCTSDDINFKKAIQGLLDLYNKEKERNMELELENIGLKENRRIAIEEIQEEYFISKDKIKKELLEPIRKEANEINKKFFEKDKGFEVEGAILQELGAIEGIILELLEENNEK